jgi:hypothetical protein
MNGVPPGFDLKHQGQGDLLQVPIVFTEQLHGQFIVGECELCLVLL